VGVSHPREKFDCVWQNRLRYQSLVRLSAWSDDRPGLKDAGYIFLTDGDRVTVGARLAIEVRTSAVPDRS
jgi:hypothetical protein